MRYVYIDKVGTRVLRARAGGRVRGRVRVRARARARARGEVSAMRYVYLPSYPHPHPQPQPPPGRRRQPREQQYESLSGRQTARARPVRGRALLGPPPAVPVACTVASVPRTARVPREGWRLRFLTNFGDLHGETKLRYGTVGISK